MIANLVVENLALRQQLAILHRSSKRPQIKWSDRIFWVLLSRIWNSWRESLIIVKPDTVIRWHKQGFKLFWKWKSRSKDAGRPQISQEIKELIYKMAMANPFLWGAPRIYGELLKLGIKISERTVSRLIPKRPPKPPPQTWRTFIQNHMHNMVSIDFFTVPTVTFRIMFVFVIIKHDRRKVVHFNATFHPTAEWTARQIFEAFPWDTAPRYMLRDRDSIYGFTFQNHMKNIGIKEIKIAPRSHWQNPYVERLIGSIRRECLDHIIILNEKHLRQILSSYFRYYNQDRTHCSLDKDSPNERQISLRPSRKCKLKSMTPQQAARYVKPSYQTFK